MQHSIHLWQNRTGGKKKEKKRTELELFGKKNPLISKELSFFHLSGDSLQDPTYKADSSSFSVKSFFVGQGEGALVEIITANVLTWWLHELMDNGWYKD